jgi:hypothetical protein
MDPDEVVIAVLFLLRVLGGVNAATWLRLLREVADKGAKPRRDVCMVGAVLVAPDSHKRILYSSKSIWASKHSSAIAS